MKKWIADNFEIVIAIILICITLGLLVLVSMLPGEGSDFANGLATGLAIGRY